MKKYFIIILCATLCTFVGCDISRNESVETGKSLADGRIEWLGNQGWGVHECVDTETGVHYFVYDDDGGMCPVYNSDGTLYVTKE